MNLQMERKEANRKRQANDIARKGGFRNNGGYKDAIGLDERKLRRWKEITQRVNNRGNIWKGKEGQIIQEK